MTENNTGTCDFHPLLASLYNTEMGRRHDGIGARRKCEAQQPILQGHLNLTILLKNKLVNKDSYSYEYLNHADL